VHGDGGFAGAALLVADHDHVGAAQSGLGIGGVGKAHAAPTREAAAIHILERAHLDMIDVSPISVKARLSSLDSTRPK
jgi:hypothetical protein